MTIPETTIPPSDGSLPDDQRKTKPQLIAELASLRAQVQDLQHEAAVLRELAVMAEYSTHAIIGETLDGIIATWNPSAERLYGYTADEVIGRSVTILVPPDRLHERAAIAARLQSGERTEAFDTVRLHQDGHPIDVMEAASPILDTEGRVISALSAGRNITPRKEAERALLTLNAELEQRVAARTRELTLINEELESFSYSVSHDLRAPLRSLNGFSQILLEEYAAALDAQGQEYLRRIRAASQRMGQLIDDLLRLARISRQELRREPVDLSARAGSIAAELQQSQPDRAVQFHLADGLQVQGDGTLLHIVLENLLRNAWKYTRDQPQARIEFGRAEDDAEPVFFVRDNGAGFDMAYADKLFGTFQRLHHASQFEGNGIGLATVRRIVHRHGGRVWAVGAVGQGATFFFTLGD